MNEKPEIVHRRGGYFVAWPTAPEPSPMTRDEIEAAKVRLIPRDRSVFKERSAAKGWWFNSYGGRVEPAWSDGTTHGWGNHTGDSGSQGMGRIYRTFDEARLAMRWAMCREFAERLRRVDLLEHVS